METGVHLIPDKGLQGKYTSRSPFLLKTRILRKVSKWDPSPGNPGKG